MLRIIHYPAASHLTTQWAGGTTTQLFIFPEDASYSERNFQFRISTATIEIPESTFTSLPGYARWLMVLGGELFIDHANHHQCTLTPFAVDSFDGSWHTVSKGLARDFNLMVAAGMQGGLKAIQLGKGEKTTIAVSTGMHGFYVHKGRLTVNEHTLAQGDFAFAEAAGGQDTTILLTAAEDLVLVQASVYQNTGV